MAVRSTQRFAQKGSRITSTKSHINKSFSTIDANLHASYAGQNSSNPRDPETGKGNGNREDELVSFTGAWIGDGKGQGSK